MCCEFRFSHEKKSIPKETPAIIGRFILSDLV